MSEVRRSTYAPATLSGSASLQGRICVVTGAARGIGKATAAAFAQRGATVVMICRDAETGARAVDEVQRGGASAGGSAALISCDLASRAAIESGANAIAARWPAIHVLVNNAGISRARRALSDDGIEMTFAVNHLAPFMLTHLLLPQLRAGAPSCVVNVTSELERWGRIDFDDLQSARRYNGTRAYLQSKLANVLFTYELAERLRGSGIAVRCVYPGLVATDLLRDRWWWRPRWLAPLWRRLFLSADAAADTVVRAATAAVEAGTPEGCFSKGGRSVRTSRRSYDATARARLWEASARLTQLTSLPPRPGR